MRRIVIWLLPLLLLAACGSGVTTIEPEGVAAPGDDTAPTEALATSVATEEATSAPDEEPEVEATTATSADDDPLLARERDWKLGDLVDPAVTIIEYGDFQ